MQEVNRRRRDRCGHTRRALIETLETRHLLAGEPLLISEFMAANAGFLEDRYNEFSDWLEIYNPTDQEVPLAGWSLTDDLRQPQRWTLPEVSIAPHGTLLVFASGRDRTSAGSELHTNFSLGADGEYLALVRPDGSTSHEYSPRFPAQRGDVSYGLVFDAQGPRLGEYQFFGQPTPDAPNTVGPGSFATAVTFSVERGFFDEPFEVTLSSETLDSVVRYTTDGSLPTIEQGELYAGPIRIETTTTLRAVAYRSDLLPGTVATQTYIFLDDVLKQTGEGMELPTEWGYFDDQGPARPARGRANYAMDPDVVNHELYRDTIKDDLRSIPTLSLVLDPDDLWDFDTGLYMNPERRGDQWERAVSMEWIMPNGETAFQANAGIEIHGGWARRISQTAKFSFRVSFRRQYGEPILDYPLFGPDAAHTFSELVLRGGFNDSWPVGDRNNTYMQDQWARETQRAMGGDASHHTYVHLYLNGLYWGMYSPTERPDALWAANYQGGDPGDYDVINTGGNVVDGDGAAWTELSRSLTPSRFDYQAVAELVDIESFVDYLIVNQYIGNWDWPHNNWYASRQRVDGGKWHFHSWDAEAAFQRGIAEDRVNIAVDGSVGPSALYRVLREVPEFRQIYSERIAKHFFNGGVLTVEANVERLNAIAAQIDRAIVGESARWGDGRVDNMNPPAMRDSAWIPRIRNLTQQYFPGRAGRMLTQYRTAGFFPDIDPPTVDPPGGQFTSATDVTISTDIGDIYYTTDGSDPWQADGRLSPTAIRLNSVDLVRPEDPAKLLVPTGAASENGWTAVDFDDTAWSAGAATFGYDNGISDDPFEVPDGFNVVAISSTVNLNTLDDVDRLLAGENQRQTRTETGVPAINYHGTGRDAHFDNSLAFPITGNDFALDITGRLVVRKTGVYTFGVTSNDAARLSLNGELLYADTTRHNANDVFVTTTLAAGEHDLHLTYFQRSTTATLEFYYAPGERTAFDDGFLLVGDVQNVPFKDQLLTDLQAELDGKNATVYTRIPFIVDSLETIEQLQLRMRYDDGFVAYLNGTEIVRRHAPDQLAFDSAATQSRGDAVALGVETIDLTSWLDVLRPGENLLAIQALNIDASDNDLLIIPQLVAVVAPQPFTLSQSATVKAQVVVDDRWSAVASIDFSMAVPASAENLRISEVHYHPADPSDAELAAGFDVGDDFEFIELVNVSDQAIDLRGVAFEQLTLGDTVEGLAFRFSNATIQELGPGGYVVIVENLNAFRHRYGNHAPVAGQWSGGLGNSSETITLAANGVTLQQFAYRDNWHPMTDGNGPSLEHVDPTHPNLSQWAQASGWRPSAVQGGTPGYSGQSSPGDTNRDGIFDSLDLLLVMQAAEFEDDLLGNSTWDEGDWDGDGDFTTRDLILAFARNTYVGSDLPAAVSALLANSWAASHADSQKRLRPLGELASPELYDLAWAELSRDKDVKIRWS